MVFCIEKFSSALCLVLGTSQGNDNLSPQCFELTCNSEDVENVIYALGEIFEEELHCIVLKIIEEEDLHRLDVIMKATLPLYMEISDNPTYLSFLLVSCLAATMVSKIFDIFNCFSTAVVSSLCLRIVYEKCYKDLFDNGASECLGSFCRKIRPRLLTENDDVLLPVDILQPITALLFSLFNIDGNHFTVTDSEMEMFYEILAPVPPESVLPMTIGEPRLPSTKEEEATDCSNLHEADLSRVNKICVICEGRCFKFLVLYQAAVLQNGHL